MIFDGKDAATLFFRYFGIEPAAPDLPFLERIVQAFTHLPYENVTKIIRYNKYSNWDLLIAASAVRDASTLSSSNWSGIIGKPDV